MFICSQTCTELERQRSPKPGDHRPYLTIDRGRLGCQQSNNRQEHIPCPFEMITLSKAVHSTIFLVPIGTAAPCRRREPPVLKAREQAASRKLTTPPNSIEPQPPSNSAQLRLDDVLCNGTHPARRQCTHHINRRLAPPAEDVPSLSGLRKWLRISTAGQDDKASNRTKIALLDM